MWFVFFFNDTATTEIYTLSLHDALPILRHGGQARVAVDSLVVVARYVEPRPDQRRQSTARDDLDRDRPEVTDRKSTRLNSSHANISYAVFCLKKKKTIFLISTIYFRYCY